MPHLFLGVSARRRQFWALGGLLRTGLGGNPPWSTTRCPRGPCASCRPMRPGACAALLCILARLIPD
eukprot:4784832-Pyramimonas_sp.AAC.1